MQASRRRHAGTWRGARSALCLLLLLAASAWALWYFGYTLLTALVMALALGCLVAIVYGWWIGRRALQSVEDARASNTKRPWLGRDT
jgi:drug/metabolite transporter (DMT)-like permease